MVIVAKLKDGTEVQRVALSEEDATTEAIAAAAIALIQSSMSMDVGDVIEVFNAP